MGMTEPETRPGEFGRTAEAQKIADVLYSKFKTDSEASRKKTVRELVIQWWVADAAIVTALVTILFTGAPLIGRVAWSNEVSEKIEDANRTFQRVVTDRIDGVERKVDDLSDVVTEQVIANLASNICRYSARRIAEKDTDERQRLLIQINEMKAKYRKYAKTDFETADC